MSRLRFLLTPKNALLRRNLNDLLHKRGVNTCHEPGAMRSQDKGTDKGA